MEILNHEISLKAIEKEDNTNLLGPAATNEIFVAAGPNRLVLYSFSIA